MNTTLTSLELNSNNIDYDGALALAEAVTENTSLSSLHLRFASQTCSQPVMIHNSLSAISDSCVWHFPQRSGGRDKGFGKALNSL